MRVRRFLLLLVAVSLFLLTSNLCQAQEETPKKRIRSPATVRGLVGGESQNRYVIRARKGQTMTIQISWKQEDQNTASFGVVADSKTESEPVAGKETDNGRRWSGKIPKTGDYLIEVVAHPSAHYKLRVAVR